VSIDIEHPNEIRQLFLDFLLLQQIRDSPEGISGYELQKKINAFITNKSDGSHTISFNKLSQTRVYRVLDEFKSKGYVSVKENVIINKRLQNLFHLSELGTKYYADLSATIQDFFPADNSIENILGDLLSGKKSPFSVFYDKIPEGQLLHQLKEFRKILLKELKEVESKIGELEAKKGDKKKT